MSVSEPPRVLVVEDEPAIREALCRYLRRRGCAVEVAADGIEGLGWVARARFDAIVSDVQMPSVDGAAFWQQAVALHPYLRDRFLFCSALPLPDPLASDRSIRFIRKPYELAAVWSALTNLLGLPSSSSD